jgi:hypothetical protein
VDQSDDYDSRWPADFDVIEVPGIGGQIGMTGMPGETTDKLSPFMEIVDLDSQLARIKAWGASLLLSLVQDFEYSADDFDNRIPEGIYHIKLPIVDSGIPDSSWEDSWKKEGPKARGILREGGKICIHCVGGHGRTGTIAVRILVELGMKSFDAVKLVRGVRPKCIESPQQWEYLETLDYKIKEKLHG